MKLLEDVFSENSFCEVDKFEYVSGSAITLYIRLKQVKTKTCGDCDCDGLRYLPKVTPTPTLSLKFGSIEDERVITKSATMAYPNDDRSIWKVDILPTDTISGMLSGTLTEGSKVTQIPLQGRLMVSSGDGSDTFC